MGRALGDGFGCNEGDEVTYRLPAGMQHPAVALPAALLLRYRMARGESVRLSVTGSVRAEVELTGSGDFATLRLDIADERAAPVHRSPSPRPAAQRWRSTGWPSRRRTRPIGCALCTRRGIPCRSGCPGRSRTRSCSSTITSMTYYGLAWGAGPSVVREFYCDELDSFMRLKVQEHVQETLLGPGEGHFTNVYMRPIVLEPGAERVVYGLVCCGDQHSVSQRLASFDPDAPQWPAVHAAARRRAVSFNTTEAGEPYRFSQERMAATLLCNVVYPVRARGTWIRHNTPGRWWDCLYTWDSGFIGLGLLELDEQRAIDCLNAYVTEPGERDAAFIHHGSPVPTQFYLFQELWNRTQSRELLAHFYPRLQQYHRFLAGRLGSSTTRTLKSNLLRTWDYFYNSGGWDDYPPQVYVHKHKLEASVTPVINTSQAILTAKILRMAALALGEPVQEYDDDIAMFSHALHSYAWDEASGYFGYVCQQFMVFFFVFGTFLFFFFFYSLGCVLLGVCDVQKNFNGAGNRSCFVPGQRGVDERICRGRRGAI